VGLPCLPGEVEDPGLGDAPDQPVQHETVWFTLYGALYLLYGALYLPVWGTLPAKVRYEVHSEAAVRTNVLVAAS
jgi:hypothetical protein